MVRDGAGPEFLRAFNLSFLFLRFEEDCGAVGHEWIDIDFRLLLVRQVDEICQLRSIIRVTTQNEHHAVIARQKRAVRFCRCQASQNCAR